MKKLRVIVPVLSMLPAFAIAANLITNPGLEQGSFVPTDWGTMGGGTLTYLQNQTSGNNCHTGTKAVSIQSPSPFMAGWYNTNFVPASMGQTYQVRAWVRSINFDSDDFVITYFEQYDAAKTSLGVLCGTGILGSSNWREISDVFAITNPSVATVRVFFLFGRSATATTGQAIYDDVTLELLSSPPSPSAIKAISHVGGLVTLSITNPTAGTSHSVERTLDLSTSWTTAGTFVATCTMTNWSQEFSNQWQRGFYRVTTTN